MNYEEIFVNPMFRTSFICRNIALIVTIPTLLFLHIVLTRNKISIFFAYRYIDMKVGCHIGRFDMRQYRKISKYRYIAQAYRPHLVKHLIVNRS